VQRADEEAAKLYEEFAASFSSEPDKPDGRSFVRGGTIQPGSRPSAGATHGLLFRALANEAHATL